MEKTFDDDMILVNKEGELEITVPAKYYDTIVKSLRAEKLAPGGPYPTSNCEICVLAFPSHVTRGDIKTALLKCDEEVLRDALFLK